MVLEVSGSVSEALYFWRVGSTAVIEILRKVPKLINLLMWPSGDK